MQPARYERSAEVDVRRLETTLRSQLEGEVRFDAAARALYSVDAGNYRQPPIGVVIPRTTDDVVAAVEIARRFGAPVLSRGGGTSLAGQCCNTGVVIDFSKHLDRILELDPERRIARVQPGVVLDELRDAAESHGLTFGPDPATHAWCTIGGMIGNNACGAHALMAGRTSDNVESLEVLTYDGLRLEVGATSDDGLRHLASGSGRRAEIYRTMAEIRDRHAGEIRRRYPAIPRRVSGYNLDELLPEKGFHVARALVGSESTCVTVLAATLRLVPSPPHRALAVLGFEDVFAAADHVPDVLAFEPVGLEGMDRKLIGYMRRKGMHPAELELLPDGQGWLMAEFGGDSAEEAERSARRLADRFGGNGTSATVFTEAAQQSQIWEIRESGLGATARVPGEGQTWPGWEDAAVAPADAGRYLRDFRELLTRYGYDAALYGHFGDGCIHCRIDFDLESRQGIEHYRRFAGEAADLVVSYHGSLSGEHGDGQSRGPLLVKMFGEELMAASRDFKRAWDPEWKMNPGKSIDADPIDADLRLDVERWHPETHFAFRSDGGDFSRAALRCVGVGKCRRKDDAFMCPSFLATREEQHTTRGRAHVLFEMTHGGVIRDRWKSQAVADTLDLCLGCKGCKSECPVNVDLARYKSEFLAHHWSGRIRPRHHYAMGRIGRWVRLGMRAPGIANFFGQNPPFAAIGKWLGGISQERTLPRFAGETFRGWFEADGGRMARAPARPGGSRNGHPRPGARGTVVLYPDLFTDCFEPEIPRAAAWVLVRLGWHVRLPERQAPAIRPLLHYGFLDEAKEALRTELHHLGAILDEGLPIIGLEPSTVSVFRDELSDLLPDEPRAERAARSFRLLDEHLERAEVDPPRFVTRALFHAHCHQKAVLEASASRRLLERMGVAIEEPEKGCCGMAGSFGLESEHYALSKQIADMHLLPAARAAGDAMLLIADGFSCRTQIEDGVGRRPLHLAQVLYLALAGQAAPHAELPLELAIGAEQRTGIDGARSWPVRAGSAQHGRSTADTRR